MGEFYVTKVPRTLEMKTKLFGFEIADLVLIFMTLSITNFVFGSTRFRYPLVWGITLTLAGVLHFAKRGRPDGFIQHYCEFLFSKGYRAAGSPDTLYKPFKKGNTEI